MSRLARTTYALLAVSFAGLGVTRWIADHYFGGEKEFMQTPVGGFLVWTFAFIWLVALLGLLPVSMLRNRRNMPESEMTIYPWWQWLLLIPYVAHDNNAKVPRWIYIPIFAVAFILAGFLLIVFVAMGLHQLFGNS
jgi:hypothetical protein